MFASSTARRVGRLAAFSLGVCVWVCSLAASAWALDVPPLEGLVNDRAGVLSPDAERELEQKLSQYERTSGHEFAVLTLKTLEGDALEDFSIRVVQAWKLGKKGKDDGLLLLVVIQDRKARVEVGYGLEGTITDALSSRVIRNLLAPAFRRGDYASGIDRSLSALMVAASGPEGAPPNAPVSGPKRGRPAVGIVGSIIGLLVMGPFLLALLAALRVLGGTGRRRGFGAPIVWGSHDWSSGPRGGGGFGGGSFGGGGGGFSGGGGSFGGGGASGSW